MPYARPNHSNVRIAGLFIGLSVFNLALALGQATVGNINEDYLQLFITAFVIPAGFGLLTATTAGYGSYAPHRARMVVRIVLTVAIIGTLAAGIYASNAFARSIEDGGIRYFIGKVISYVMLAGFMALTIIRYSTSLRSVRGLYVGMAGAGAALILLSGAVGLWFGYETSEDHLLVAMMLSCVPIGMGVALVTAALKQAGYVRLCRQFAIAGSVVMVAMALTMGIWFTTVSEKDYTFIVVTLAITPIALAALTFRICYTSSQWSLLFAWGVAAASLALGIWTAAGEDELVEVFLFPVSTVTGIVSGFFWVFLASSIVPLAVSLYAVFIRDERWVERRERPYVPPS